MQNTTHYNLKKPDYTDFADIQDINDNMDTIDAELAAPTGDGRDQTVSFTDADLDSGITSFPTFLTKIVSGMKLAKFLRDFKAGMAYVLHVGSLVNNATCTESGKALDARMGKTLQDQITSLNDSFATKGRLIARDDVTTNIVTKTLPNGETFSNYRALVFVAQVNSSTRGSLWIPAGRFADGYDCYVIATAGTTIGNIYVRYVSDTSYFVRGDNAAFNYLAIYAG